MLSRRMALMFEWPVCPLTRIETETLIEKSLVTSPRHPIARCRWCGSEFVFIDARTPIDGEKPVQVTGHWICQTPACAERQLRWAMEDKRAGRADDASRWIYVPTPAGTELHESQAPNLCLGGAAGGTKSHGLRWHGYWWCDRIPGYRVLLIRQTFTELENTHLMKMHTHDQHLLSGARYVKEQRTLEWSNGAFVKAGHCHTPKDVETYLSQEWDEIDIDEASRLDRKVLTGLTSRARSESIRPAVRERGGGFARLATNPGGPGSSYIEDHYITRNPDPRKHKKYHPEHYAFVFAQVEDNPYLEEDYVEKRLDPLDPDRYEQLRHGRWGSFDGQFFTQFKKDTHVVSP
jgi:phage terminase large subunit